MVKIKYNHPSISKFPIDVHKIYQLIQIKDKYFIKVNKKRIEISLNDLNTFFKIIDGTIFKKINEKKELKTKKS